MHVRVLCFGVLKDWLGAAAATIELPEGAAVAALLDSLRERRSSGLLQGIAVSVNAQFATAAQVLCEGDEVGLLPPVSGGAVPLPRVSEMAFGGQDSIALTSAPIDAEGLVPAIKQGEDGAVVVFDGIVRNHTRGRQTLYLDYEAYEEMAG